MRPGFLVTCPLSMKPTKSPALAWPERSLFLNEPLKTAVNLRGLLLGTKAPSRDIFLKAKAEHGVITEVIPDHFDHERIRDLLRMQARIKDRLDLLQSEV